MTDYPCLADTASIAQLLTSSGYEADVIVSPDSTNGISATPSGLTARQGVTSSARIASNATSNTADGTFVVPFNVVRWDTTGGLIVASPNVLTTNAPGLWLVGACLSISQTSPGTFPNYFAYITAGGVNIAGDGASVGSALYTPTPAEFGQQVGLNPCCIVEVAAGTQFGLSITVQIGAALIPASQIVGSSSPPTASATTNEMAGTEMWACLLRPI